MANEQMRGATVTLTLDRPTTPAIPPCVQNPDRWADGGNDPTLKAICRRCPRRWLCAKEALRTPGIQGMIGGVHVPKEGRARTFAMRQLQSLAAYAGYTSQPIIP